MTRDEFVKKFKWDTVMWVVGMGNVIALLPQPIAILRTHEVAGISIMMYVLFAIIQFLFGVEFYIKKSWGPMASMGISVLLSLTTIGLVLYFR